MSGHSKWRTIKHAKGLADKKKAILFTKLARNISLAAKEGKDPESNFKLRLALETARKNNLPKDNIEKALKRGTGESKEGLHLDEVIYEGMHSDGIAIIIEALTDNKNRSAAEIKRILSQFGFRSDAKVMWLFHRKVVIRVPLATYAKTLESLELSLIDLGCEELIHGTVDCIIISAPENFQKIKEFLEKNKIAIEYASINFVPKEGISSVSESSKKNLEGLFDALEDCQDVNEWYTNLSLLEQ